MLVTDRVVSTKRSCTMLATDKQQGFVSTHTYLQTIREGTDPNLVRTIEETLSRNVLTMAEWGIKSAVWSLRLYDQKCSIKIKYYKNKYVCVVTHHGRLAYAILSLAVGDVIVLCERDLGYQSVGN